MKTKNKILVLFLIIPILNLVYLFLYKKDDKILGHLDSIVGSIGQSTGTILVLLLINLIYNFIINKKWEIRLSNLNFIVYSLIIIGLFLKRLNKCLRNYMIIHHLRLNHYYFYFFFMIIRIF